MIYIITALLLVKAAVANALMDISAEGKLSGGWWNKETSWRNKWKLGQPKNGPAFPGSTTIFVWITDGWHFFQMIFHTCWQLAIAIQFEQWFIYLIVIKVLFSFCFELIYSQLKKKL